MGKDLADYWIGLWEPKNRGTIYEWARDEKNTYLSPPLTKEGAFDVSTSRHMIGLFDSFQNERKRETNVCAPVRGAKTLFADICHLWTIKIRPGPTLFLFQDDKAAQDQAEARTWPNVEKSHAVSALLPRELNKQRATSIIFPHMPFHIRGPAKSNLQSRGYQYVWVDEPWQYDEGKIEEARGRLGDYAKMGTDKFVCLSQGGVPRSDWDRQYNRGIIHEWHVQCMSCGHYMLPVWRGNRADGSLWGMRWDAHKTAAGLWNPTKVIPTIRFECEKCAHPHIWSNRTKLEWNRTGKYIAEETTEKLTTKDSFHWTAVVDYPWDQLVDLYLGAVNAWKVGTTEPLVQFFQKRMAQMCNEETLLGDSLKFRKERVELQSKPGGAVRLMAVDRQEEDVFWVMICDLFKATETEKPKIKRIYYNRLQSFGEIEELRKKMEIYPNHVLIDSGYHAKGDQGVYAMCIHYGWVPVKGVATEGGDPVWFTHKMGDGVTVQRSYSEPVMVDAGSGTGRGQFCQMIKFSAPTYTARVSHLIDHEIWIEPEGMDDDPMNKICRKQMAAEYQKEIEIGNKQVRRFKKVWHSGKENHARDTAKIQVVGADILGILPSDGELISE